LKTTFAIITLASALAASPITAADHDKAVPGSGERATTPPPPANVSRTIPGPSAVEPAAPGSPRPNSAAYNQQADPSIGERLAQMDLSVVLKQYEKILLLAHEAELQAALLRTGSDPENKEREALSIRIAILRDQADRLRLIASDLDAKIQKGREIAAENQYHGLQPKP
jgi:hypothetical protein